MLHHFLGMSLVFLFFMLSNSIASNSIVHLLTYHELVQAQVCMDIKLLDFVHNPCCADWNLP